MVFARANSKVVWSVINLPHGRFHLNILLSCQWTQDSVGECYPSLRADASTHGPQGPAGRELAATMSRPLPVLTYLLLSRLSAV